MKEYTPEELRDAFSKSTQEMLEKGLLRVMEQIGIELQSSATARAPIDTGALRASITYRVEQTDDSISTIVGTNLHYAVYQEHGTGNLADAGYPHTTKPYWRYYNKTMGRFATAHPQPGKHYLSGAFEEIKPWAMEQIEKCVEVKI